MILKKENVPDDVHPIRMEEKGNYAVAVVWSDGHRSSIYPYKRLFSDDIAGEVQNLEAKWFVFRIVTQVPQPFFNIYIYFEKNYNKINIFKSIVWAKSKKESKENYWFEWKLYFFFLILSKTHETNWLFYKT